MKLKIENGCYAYPKGERELLKNISLEIETGELTAVLGPNGAGKTTLLKCMTGLLRWDSGRSLVDGTDIRSMSYRELWSRIAYVPQARNSSGGSTVEELILLGRSSRIGLLSKPSARDIEAVESVMDRLGISDLRHKKCSRISGGELQLVLIARALASEPELLILDEPESNLDFRNQLMIMETLSALAAEGIGCIFNTHYPAHAMQRAAKALLLASDGSYIFGDTSEVITERNIGSAFGVEVVISEIRTPNSAVKDIVPLTLTKPRGLK